MLQAGPTPMPGRYFLCGNREGRASSSRFVNNNEMWLIPFQVSRSVSVDRMAISTGNASAGEDGISRIGIYTSSGEDDLPASLLVQSTDIDTDTVAGGTVFEFTISQALAPSRTYWVAVAWRRETAGSDQTWQGLSFASGNTGWKIASATAADALLNDSGRSHLRFALGAWTELPSTVDPSTATLGTGDVPAITLRVDATANAAEGPGQGLPLIALDEATKRWHSFANLAIGAGDSLTLTDGTILWYPFYALDDIEIERMAVNVLSAAGGSTIRAAIYTDSNGVPGDFVGGTGDLDAGSTGVKDVAVTAFSLAAGNGYWCAIGVSGGAPAIRCWNRVTGDVPRMSNLGFASASDALDGTRANILRSSTGYAGGGLPDPAPTTAYDAGGNMPNVAGLVAPAP